MKKRLEIEGEIQTRESQTVGERTRETVSLGRAEVTRRRASLDTPRRARASHHPFPPVNDISPAMGNPDAVAVEDAAPRSADDDALRSGASSRSDLTSSLKRARATGLDPGSALSSSFDFLNEHMLGIKVVAPEDRPMTAGDVPPAGFASPGIAAGERESSSTPASSPVAAVAAPPAPPFDSTPDDFGSPSNDPSRAATFTADRRVVGFSDADPTQFPHPSLVAYEQKTARGSDREDGRFARARASEAAARVPPPRAPRCPSSSAPRSVQPRPSCTGISSVTSTREQSANIPPRASRRKPRCPSRVSAAASSASFAACRLISLPSMRP